MFTCRIFETDTWYEMADKIYSQFEVGQSCKIEGFQQVSIKNEWDRLEQKIFAKGQLVWDRIQELHQNEHGHKKRYRVKHENLSSSRPKLEWKVFKYTKIENNEIIKWTIWRIQ